MVARVSNRVRSEIDYPESDGKPMAETPVHRDVMIEQIDVLQDRYAKDPNVYVSGNMMMYYVPDDKRRHVSSDVFVAFGIPKLPERRVYLVWQEKEPDVVFEITSKSTKKKDVKDKFELYQKLRVREYFLFDPLEEYLKPSLQGFRLNEGRYRRIAPLEGRLPSEVLGLHLERSGWRLRLYDPTTKQWLQTAAEARAAAAEARAALAKEVVARRRADAEVARLRQELEELRQRRSAR